MEEFTENLNLTETETETNDEDVEDGRATEQDPDDWPQDELALTEHAPGTQKFDRRQRGCWQLLKCDQIIRPKKTLSDSKIARCRIW